jgi:hypothetical protein
VQRERSRPEDSEVVEPGGGADAAVRDETDAGVGAGGERPDATPDPVHAVGADRRAIPVGDVRWVSRSQVVSAGGATSIDPYAGRPASICSLPYSVVLVFQIATWVRRRKLSSFS